MRGRPALALVLALATTSSPNPKPSASNPKPCALNPVPLPPAGPSQAENLHKEYLKKKEALTGQKKRDVLERYGNAAEVSWPSEPALDRESRS